METLDRKITRTKLLKLGGVALGGVALGGAALGGAALMLPMERAAKTKLAISNRIPDEPAAQALPATIPGSPDRAARRSDADTDYYQMTMKQARLQILPAPFGKTTVYGYDGVTPGPTIQATKGREVVVRHINQMPRMHATLGYKPWTSVHLHGSASLPQYDGYASDITNPGEFKDYRYPNIQPARTLWYHDHGVHHTAENAYMGCAAQYHLHDDEELSPLPIPQGRYDVPLILRDAIFAKNGEFVYDDQGHSSLYGDVILTNGVPWPRMRVERRKYRFRVLDASISRSYRLALSTGDPFTVIATDGGLMPRPSRPRGSGSGRPSATR